MRFGTLVTAGILAVQHPAGPAAQQRFEGVITMKVGMAKGQGVETHLYLKGAQARMERTGAVGVLIRDSNGRLMTVMDGAKRYVVFGKASESGLKFEAIGKSETVAGYRCKYYKVIHTDKKQEDTEACVTGAFGFVGLGIGGDSRGLDELALRSQFGDGFLVLKVLDSKGATSTEVIKVERRAVSDAMFAPPAGYIETKLPGGLTPQRP
jgi:hypothetical protein